MQRSAISIPSNIAEGFARGHTAEYRQLLHDNESDKEFRQEYKTLITNHEPRFME